MSRQQQMWLSMGDRSHMCCVTEIKATQWQQTWLWKDQQHPCNWRRTSETDLNNDWEWWDLTWCTCTSWSELKSTKVSLTTLLNCEDCRRFFQGSWNQDQEQKLPVLCAVFQLWSLTWFDDHVHEEIWASSGWFNDGVQHHEEQCKQI